MTELLTEQNATEQKALAPNFEGRQVLQVLVLAVPVFVLAWLVWHYRTIYDDGFIYLHVVQQFLAGHGLVYNTGQRVEAFTSPLWVFILSAVAVVTPFSLEWI